MAKIINIEKCFEKFNDTFSPKVFKTTDRFSSSYIEME